MQAKLYTLTEILNGQVVQVWHIKAISPLNMAEHIIENIAACELLFNSGLWQSGLRLWYGSKNRLPENLLNAIASSQTFVSSFVSQFWLNETDLSKKISEASEVNLRTYDFKKAEKQLKQAELNKPVPSSEKKETEHVVLYELVKLWVNDVNIDHFEQSRDKEVLKWVNKLPHLHATEQHELTIKEVSSNFQAKIVCIYTLDGTPQYIHRKSTNKFSGREWLIVLDETLQNDYYRYCYELSDKEYRAAKLPIYSAQEQVDTQRAKDEAELNRLKREAQALKEQNKKTHDLVVRHNREKHAHNKHLNDMAVAKKESEKNATDWLNGYTPESFINADKFLNAPSDLKVMPRKRTLWEMIFPKS